MTEWPKISVVTPSYNQGAFLERTIRSVLDQNYPDLDYIVIDGGSADQSVDIIRRHAQDLSYWVSEEDRGQSHAINKGLERANGELLTWLNSDDMLEPGALAAVAEAYRKNPEAGAFVGHGAKVNRRGHVEYYKKPSDLSFEGMCQWMDGRNFMQPSCFFTRDAWNTAGPLDEDIHIALDVDLWLRMVKQFEFVPVDILLSRALIHDDAKTTAYRNLMVVDCALVIIRHGGERFVRQHLDNLAERLTLLEERRIRHRLDRLYRSLFGPISKPGADRPSPD
ncbi:MAG: glycosyltransferase [Gammaproteobacteria bacterium]|nr:glycosyltransferase [Gammaproteobacteria bacterium]